MTPRCLGSGFVILLALALAGCGGRALRPHGPQATAGTSGLYRVTLDDPEEGRRRFRLLLFAELPDRLHGEILSPVGHVVLIFDGGAEGMAVTFVRDRLSFAGPSGEEGVERVLGLRVGLDALVRGLLTGEVDGGGLSVRREADRTPGLPERLELTDGRRQVTLELKRLQPLRAAAERLGRGLPPEGMEVRPLTELSLHEPLDLAAEGEEGP